MNTNTIGQFDAGQLNWEQTRQLREEEEAKAQKSSNLYPTVLEETTIETTEDSTNTPVDNTPVAEVQQPLQTAQNEPKIIDLSASVLVQNINEFAVQQQQFLEQMRGPLVKAKEENISLNKMLTERASEITLLENDNVKLKSLIKELENYTKDLQKQHEEIVANLQHDHTELHNEIGRLQVPDRSQINKEIVEKIITKLKEIRTSFDERIKTVSTETLESDKDFKAKLRRDLKTENSKLQRMAKEVEALFTNQAFRATDKATIDLRDHMLKLWNEVEFRRFDMYPAQHLLTRKIAVIELAKEIESTQKELEDELKNHKPLAETPGVYGWGIGYYVVTHKLGEFESHLVERRTKFDGINTKALEHENSLKELHKTFKGPMDFSQDAIRLAAGNAEQTAANKLEAARIITQFDEDYTEIYKKSVESWAKLCKAQNAVHEKLAILEDGYKSPKLAFPYSGTLNEEKKLKYTPSEKYTSAGVS